MLHSPNVDLYKVLVKELAQILERQFAGNAESRAAGMVINTMGWIENVGYEVTVFQPLLHTTLACWNSQIMLQMWVVWFVKYPFFPCSCFFIQLMH